MEVLSTLEDPLDGVAGLGRAQLVLGDLASTAARHQVIEAGPIDVFALHQVKDRVEVTDGVAGQRQAQTDSLADGDTVPDASQHRLERAVLASEGAWHAAARPLAPLTVA